MESNYSNLLEAIKSSCIVIFDDDIVNLHNVAASYYTRKQSILQMPKAQAMVENMNALMDVNVLGIKAKVPSGLPVSYAVKPVVIISTDSRRSRVLFWSHVKREDDVELLIDARSGWDVTSIHTCKMDDGRSRQAYSDSLEAEGGNIPCSARAVGYNSIGVAANVAAIVKSYANNETFPSYIMQDYKTWSNIIV